MDAKPLRTSVLLTLVMLFVPPTLASAPAATGHFEVYCDGVGIFLTKIDGAPASGKLVLFSELGFPPGTAGGAYVGQGQWSAIYVFPDGCVPDGKCKSIGDGKVWIDGTEISAGKYIPGKYEINLNGRRLAGTFRAKRRVRKRPLRLCM
ncbi:MAG TPA: hypothetical protein VKH81_17850 [Candidatus Angelobacter sp.]|nr:hypothetical protein [Candidatus Angelobacter sp.]